MDARSELFVYMGSALVTIATLFGLRYWYATYLDTHVVYGEYADPAVSEDLTTQRERERAQLAGGAMPIDEAMSALSRRSRTSFAKIRPKPSEDLSPMSGWMHRPGFESYQPRSAETASPAVPARGATSPGSEDSAPGAMAAAPGAETASDGSAAEDESAAVAGAGDSGSRADGETR